MIMVTEYICSDCMLCTSQSFFIGEVKIFNLSKVRVMRSRRQFTAPPALPALHERKRLSYPCNLVVFLIIQVLCEFLFLVLFPVSLDSYPFVFLY